MLILKEKRIYVYFSLNTLTVTSFRYVGSSFYNIFNFARTPAELETEPTPTIVVEHKLKLFT